LRIDVWDLIRRGLCHISAITPYSHNGTGPMGIILGYYLNLAEAKMSIFVRSHRVTAMARPQILYCYDDNKLKEV